MNGMKIAVIGDKDSISGFKALGLEVFPAEDAGEARSILHRLGKEKETYAIVYISEDLAGGMMDEIALYKDEVTPAVILIPSRNGSLGLGMSALTSAVERAVGSGIL